MHTEAQFVLESVLQACKSINALGDLATDKLENHVPLDLTVQEKDELSRAFKLMRSALDCADHLISVPGVSKSKAL
jgi:hypothetical protein